MVGELARGPALTSESAGKTVPTPKIERRLGTLPEEAMFMKITAIGLASFVAGLVVGVSGCNVDARWAQTTEQPGSVDTQGASAQLAVKHETDISIASAQEVDLVETTLDYRARYLKSLARLRDYYEAHGYITKADWAVFELEGLRRVKQFRYLLDAEVPSDALRPVEQIAEADELYERARGLMRRGGHGVPVVYRGDRMIEAAKLFRELIERFPASDKIDDAAFFSGEIHKDYMPGQDEIAVRWYERVWTWNPQTQHPARFEAATIYDYRLHDRARALELYRKSLDEESQHKGNSRFAARRIRELTNAGG